MFKINSLLLQLFFCWRNHYYRWFCQKNYYRWFDYEDI